MRPPDFWQIEDGRDAVPFLRAMLTPLSWLYAHETARRIARALPVRVPVPVIGVGNVTMGGTGKTPLVRLVRQKLVNRGLNAAALSRGYGGRLKGPVQVAPSVHTAGDVGDEPLILAADGLAWISADRAAGAIAAIAAGVQALVLDDGHQNPALTKDLRIVVVDAGAGFGNGRVFPAGPLREPVAIGLARADAVVVMRQSPDEVGQPTPFLPWDGPLIEAWLAPENMAPLGPIVAFCGIGRPKKFEQTLESLGADVVDLVPFPDHHPYTEPELKRLAELAAARRAQLVTTEKDMVRLPKHFRAGVTAIKVTTQCADDSLLDGLLDGALAAFAVTATP